MRKRIAFDRLLARLAVVAHGRWLLKGGFALDLRLSARARSTKDVDIEWRTDEAELPDILLDAASHELGDFFDLTIEETGVPENPLGGTQRFKVSSSLAGRPFESFVLDVGRRETGATPSETLRTDDLLAFAGIASVPVEAVALEVQVAEKLHALTRTYEGGRTSTRTKDLVDIVLISRLSSLDAEALRREVHEAFVTRDTHAVPHSVPPPPPTWTGAFRRLADEVGIPNNLVSGFEESAALLNPILMGEVTSGSWNPTKRRWQGRPGDSGE
jgi:predicted nucleotidyltransferase component of viral defense system